MDLIVSESSVLAVGDIYGRYTVLGVYKSRVGYQKYAHVQCSCGSKPRFVQVGQLRNGDSQSCGCLHKERVTKHGQWGTPLFTVWRSMMDRCTDQKNKRYQRYGGRGITVCDRWHDVHAFIADMTPGYSPGRQIDRINNDLGYSPENCRWATTRQQTRNYSRNVVVEFNGKAMCIADWAEQLGMNYGTLWDRLKQGWSAERALTTPAANAKTPYKSSTC